MTVLIRNAQVEEFDDITALAVESYREYAIALEAEHWNTMQASLSNISELAKQAQLIVATQADRLVGAVVYYKPGTSDQRLFQPEWASLRMLSVHPQHRGQCIGRQLSLACIDRAKQDHAMTIGLHTSELMHSARRIYAQLGFELDIELPRSLGIRYWRYCLQLNSANENDRSV